MFRYYFGLYCDICWVYFYWKSQFYCRYNAGFSFGTNKILTFLRLSLANLIGYFCRIMSAGSPQRRGQKEIWQP